MNRFRWVVYAGTGVLALTAAGMIRNDLEAVGDLAWVAESSTPSAALGRLGFPGSGRGRLPDLKPLAVEAPPGGRGRVKRHDRDFRGCAPTASGEVAWARSTPASNCQPPGNTRMTPDPTKVPHPPPGHRRGVVQKRQRMPGDRTRRTDGAGPGGRRPTVSAGPPRIRAKPPGGSLRAPRSQEGGGRPDVIDLSRRIRSGVQDPAVMGKILVEAVRTASARAGKTPWWRRSPQLVDPHGLSVVRQTSCSGKPTRTSRDVYDSSIGEARSTAPPPPVWPTAWRASKGSSDARCRSWSHRITV